MGKIICCAVAVLILTFLEIIPIFSCGQKKLGTVYCVITALALVFLVVSEIYPAPMGLGEYLTDAIRKVTGGRT